MWAAKTQQTHETLNPVEDWAAIGAAVRRATRDAVIRHLAAGEGVDIVVRRGVDHDRSVSWIPRLVGRDATA